MFQVEGAFRGRNRKDNGWPVAQRGTGVDWGAGSETAGGRAGLGDFMGRVRVYFILKL